jgi:hypothetical protein
MLTLLTQGMPQKLTGYLMVFMLVWLVVGCGGGGDERASLQGEADKSVDIVARTGPILAVRVGETANLSDNNSFTTSSESLSFHWSFASRPDGSNAVLQNATSANPSFVADVWGAYRPQLVVSAGALTSQRAIQLVVATIPPEPDTGPVNHQGLSSNCVICHDDEISGISPKVGNHVATTNTCETCHTPLGFTIVSFVDHLEVFGNCSGCHNGVQAIGKSEFHLPTNAECDSCHNTTSFFTLNVDGSFDHTGITSGCVDCHNGNAAIGKTPSPPHPDTSVECVACHTTASFKNAFPDHTGPAVVGTGITCDSCHGVSAIGQPNGHPVTVVDCNVCHSITSFSMGGVFEHRLVDATIQSCESCHNETNSINAPAKSSAVPAHPVTSTDCASCHNTDSFSPAFGIDHTDPAVLALRCDSCHNGIDASGLPTSTALYAHMPFTTEDCGDCHTPGTFTTGTYNHAGVINGCNTCHDNRISVGKLFNHIPTNPDTQDCADCHNTTDFTAATFDHTGINTGNCALCHDNNISTGKPANHLPTTQNCFECHNYTDPSFNTASIFFHNGITANCETCHNGNPDFVAVGAIGKKFNHIPALGACVMCHSASSTNPGDFAPSATFVSAVHDSITRGCEGCHTSQFLPLPTDPAANLVKEVNHVPTSQDCDVCHNINGFTPTTMLAHEGITGNCVSCHDGSPNFIALGARGKTPTPPHPATAADCALCHNTVNFADAYVDHSDPAVLAQRCDSCHVADGTGTAQGMDAGHVLTTEDCGVCHAAGGSFKPAVFNHTGIVDNCASCHDGVIATGTDAKVNPPHIPITQDCSVCHTPTSFAQATFDHQGILNNCGSCHNGITATGKDNDHVPTNGDCVDCHQTTGFLPATFDHAGIVNNCSSCHAAGFATPKKTNHVPTNQDCGVCHNPSAFIPATFDHTGIVNNCVSCHDGNTAIGMMDAVPAHIPTSLDCASCHSTATFVGGSWTHDSSSVGNCDTCHSPGGGATFKPGGHLSTTEQCDACHTTNGWAPTSFNHDPQGNYPGDHRIDPGCNGCHGPTISSGTGPPPFPWLPSGATQYAPFCAACHANDFESEGDHIGGNSGTVAQNKNCGGSGCHRISDSNFD